MPSAKPLLLLLVLLLIPALPKQGFGQVNLPAFRNTATGELIEHPYRERYRNQIRDIEREERLARSEKLQKFDDRHAKYAADPCGLGCDLHEGLQVHGIPGTFLSAALYKARIEDDGLVVQLRFFNDGAQPARLTLDPSAGSFFVRAGNERLRILADENGELESKGAVNEMLDPGEIESWWARFPAPSADAEAFDLHIPGVTFGDVPLETD